MNDGTHISTGIGSNFQHARLQRLLDGSLNICAFILYLESELTVDTSLNYDGKTKIELSDILEISYSEVTDLLTQNNVPIIQREITRTTLDISTLMIAFEIAVIEVGRRRDIDVFTQDAVDNIKGRLRESF